MVKATMNEDRVGRGDKRGGEERGVVGREKGEEKGGGGGGSAVFQ